MKKNTVFILAIIVLSALIVVPTAETVNAADVTTLNIVNWGDYIDTKLLETDFKEFVDFYKARTGKDIKVNYREYDTNEAMLTQVMNSNSIDMLAPSEYAIQKLLEKDLIQKIGTDEETEAFWSNIEPLFKTSIEETFGSVKVGDKEVDMTDYFVPYMWGTLGILYNKDVVTESDLKEGWGLLWNKAGNSKLTGKIYMKDSIRDIYVAAVMYLKENDRLPEGFKDKTVVELINSTDQALIDAAETVLIEQKSQKILYSVDFDKEEVIAGNAYLDLAWSGDAVYAIEEAKKSNINLGYYIPESGSNIWFDGWVITKNAPNPEAAKLFIEFMNRPDIAVRNMIAIGYTSGVSKEVLKASEEAKNVLTENDYDVDEFFNNEVQYFNGTMPMGVMKDFGDRESLLFGMLERVKIASAPKTDGDNSALVTVIIVVAVIVIIGAIVALVVTKKNKAATRRKVSK